MNEDFLSYVWKFKVYKGLNLKTTEGEILEIVHTGQLNTDAGPDFFNARLRIGDKLWAGNVEIHLKSSDWEKHGHSNDRAYDNVILHVVYEHDKEVVRSNNERIPTFVLKDQLSDNLLKNYQGLLKTKSWVYCENHIQEIDPFKIRSFFHHLLCNRLERKTKEINQYLTLHHNDWEEVFYHFLARSFGLKVNADPFQLLAKSIPLKVLRQYRSQPMLIEALLFGQAGFLNEEVCTDPYFMKLKEEFSFLKTKYNLRPNDKSIWKFLRLRPNNFPTIRIAQFAALIVEPNGSFNTLIRAQSVKEIRKYLACETSSYWKTHYNFGKPVNPKSSQIGSQMADHVIINCIVPFLFSYADYLGNNNLKDKALILLEELRPEENSIIKKWAERNLIVENAYDSQALIELKNEFCNNKRCLHCVIGTQIVKIN